MAPSAAPALHISTRIRSSAHKGAEHPSAAMARSEKHLYGGWHLAEPWHVVVAIEKPLVRWVRCGNTVAFVLSAVLIYVIPLLLL